MFDIAPTELLLTAGVALVVIGPKDLPRAMRFVGKWAARARSVSRQFRDGLDTMMREAELAELEQKWAAENERIMREHPVAALPPSEPTPAGRPLAELGAAEVEPAPVMVERPVIRPSDGPEARGPQDKAAS